MYLLIDQGNSRTKACIYQQGQFTSIELGDVTAAQWQQIVSIWVSSVASAERQQQLQHFPPQVPCHFVRSQAKAFEVKNSYQQPERLGVDRWLAMIGARHLYPNQALLVVDAGTALTMDWLAVDGQHLGGWILAGLNSQQQLVVAKTAQVQAADLTPTALTTGCSTTDAVAEGAKAAILGATLQAVNLMPVQQVILTGGDAGFIQDQLATHLFCYEANLIFQGLACFIDNQ